MNAAEIAAWIRYGEKDPAPYKTEHARSSRPFIEQHGQVTGTTFFPPNGWMEHSVYEPRWYTDDQYADQIAHAIRGES